jgi:chemotaxis protein MotA
MGLIGTLIGLIQLLSSLNDPTQVGPSMSLALVSTLYGSLAANLCFLPLAGKLRSRNDQETLTRRITIEGVIGLASLESPTVLAQKLRSFVAG